MTVLSTQQQAHVNALLDELLDLPEDRRSQRLHSHGVDDPAVLSEVESLLRAALAADGFLRSPARPAVEAPASEVASGMRLGPGGSRASSAVAAWARSIGPRVCRATSSSAARSSCCSTRPARSWSDFTPNARSWRGSSIRGSPGCTTVA